MAGTIRSTKRLMNADELRKKADAIHWFHTMDLGNGVVTKGIYDPRRRLHLLGIPEDLTGKRVLDIGAWDGFYSFECERRGAASVLATDHFCWSGDGWGTKAGFDLARQALNSKVQDKEIDVLDISPEIVGEFDLVLFLGVLYHMKHPLLSLERAASVTGDMLIVETEVDFLGTGRPAMAFYEGSELNNDNTNWCGPNPACVMAMLRTAGFQSATAYSRIPSLPYRMLRAMYRKFRYGKRMLHDMERERVIFHARKRQPAA